MKRVTEFLDRPVTMAHAFAGIFGIILAVLIMGSTASAAEFQKGSEYKTTYVQGYVHLTCHGFMNGRYVTLRRSGFCNVGYDSPASTSKFINEGSKAYKVKITNHSNKNKSKTKTFYPDKGESKRFNLLIHTLFQKPLLVVGDNELTYQMILKSGEVIESGPLSVSLETEERYCPTGYIYSSNIDDCRTGPSFATCDRHFYQSGCLR